MCIWKQTMQLGFKNNLKLISLCSSSFAFFLLFNLNFNISNSCRSITILLYKFVYNSSLIIIKYTVYFYDYILNQLSNFYLFVTSNKLYINIYFYHFIFFYEKSYFFYLFSNFYFIWFLLFLILILFFLYLHTQFKAIWKK